MPSVARAVACVAVVAGAAHADSAPDPIATRAGQEANLESTEHRQGFTFSVGIGPSITVGGGTGTGGGLAVRVGQVIRTNAITLVEATYNGQGHKAMSTLHINDYTTVMGGLQVWIGPFAYFRTSAGFGAYRCKQCKDPDDSSSLVPVDYVRRGLTGSTAFGVEPLRLGSVTLGPEVTSILTLTPRGVILSLTFAVVASFD